MTPSETSTNHNYNSTWTTIAWLVRHMMRYPIWTVFFATCVVASVYFQTVSAVYLGRFFETLKLEDHRQMLLAVTLVLAVLTAGALLQWGSALAVLNIRLRVEKNIRHEIFTSFLHKKHDYLNTARTGDLLAIGTNELRSLSVMFQPGLIMSLRSVLFYLLPLFFIFRGYHWTLWLLPVCFTVISAWLLVRYSRQIGATTTEARQEFGQLNADLNEMIEGVEIIKANLQESREVERFERRTQAFADKTWARALIEAKYLPTLVYHVFFSGAFLHALLAYMNGGLMLGELITYMGLFLGIGTPVANAEITFGFISMGLASSKRIRRAIGEGGATVSTGSLHQGDMQGRLEFEQVSFGFEGERPLLKSLSFSVKAGQTVAIVGTTGSGKSLLTKLVNRSFEATAGMIRIDGIDIKAWDMDRLREQIGIIEQDVFLFSWSVRDNIAFANPELTAAEMERYARLAHAHDFIEQLAEGYETRVGERGVHLSGGQRQRIAMARAFASEPRILILDDSTSGLDSATESEIVKGMHNLMQHRTTLLITNRLPLIVQADHVIVLRQGEIVAQGAHRELLLHSEAYRDLFIQKEVV